MPITVQLNHPSNEKPFIIGNGYFQVNNQIVREWNNDTLPDGKQPHYRKFICNSGEFIVNLKSKPQKGNLLFWGEWEGNSFFTPLIVGSGTPNGIHEPFHSIEVRGVQNTDPYVFGDFFKYAICSQNGIMCNLSNGSLILFGTTTNIGFLLDTVFVIKKNESAASVSNSNAINYTNVYREETLEQLGSIYLGANPSSVNKIYHSQTWWDCDEYFSFVPCKIASSNCYSKAILNFSWMAKQKVGHPFKHFANRKPIDIWNDIVDSVLKQGFSIGVKLYEPSTNTILTNNQNLFTTKVIKQACRKN
jgi:hypothetical protein